MSLEARSPSELDTENHAPLAHLENPAPQSIDERGFHMQLRELCTSLGLSVATLMVPESDTVQRANTQITLPCRKLGALVIVQTEFRLCTPDEIRKNRLNAWKRIDSGYYGFGSPTYPSHGIDAGSEIVRMAVTPGGGLPATRLLKSTATLQTLPANELQVAEAKLLVGSHTPAAELVLPDKNGYPSSPDIQRLIGELAADSHGLFAA